MSASTRPNTTAPGSANVRSRESPSAFVSVVVDGKPVRVAGGATLLDAIRASGGWVPTLCHLAHGERRSVCRLCIVEVGGRVVTSCDRQAVGGEEILTGTERLVGVRRTLMELVLAEHGSCGEGCEVESLALRLGVSQTRFSVPRPAPERVGGEFLEVRLDRCVHCDRCIRSCDRGVIARRGEGGNVTMGFDGGPSIDASRCTGCGDCVAACPARVLEPSSRPLLEGVHRL
ncbi:MAG: 4Fe-4S dicluster domain-containing protein [Deltaproteobacteria bacterium]|nr:4Fe-4S dicluster domain-containing protein [Deltaproteobacteria bacterium]